MQRLNPFRHLRGKMTLTYTAVTGGVALVFWVLLIWLILAIDTAPVGTPMSGPIMGIIVDDITAFVQASPPDQQGLQAYLDLWVSGDRLRVESENGSIQAVFRGLDYIAVTDEAGNLLAIEPQVFPLDQETLPLPPEVGAAYSAILAGEDSFRNVSSSYQEEEAFYHLQALPEGSGGLIVVFGPEILQERVENEVALIFAAVSALLLCGAAVMGTLFGWLASRWLVRRIRVVQQTVSTWEKGDLKPRIDDQSSDEIGQMSGDLNQMAKKLDDLIATESSLAVLEERNRLARELHDTVKQQMFAASMQLSSARALIQDNPAAADEILNVVEMLTDQIQVEFADMIQTLRPAALADQGLVAALQAYVEAWSQRTVVPVELVVQGERQLPLVVEQELYRVAQEALANIEKHAQATHVVMRLSWQPHALTLEIQDDGIGFDSSSPTSGFGLQSMNERLAPLPGLVTIESHPGRGSRVTAVVELEI